MWFVKALLVASVLVLTEAGNPGDGIHNCIDNDSCSNHLVELMNAHFDKSVNYILTSKQYDSQYMERPGMAKLLKEASDEEWEEGMDTLKKYMQRGGNIGTFNNKININAEAQLANYNTRFASYSTTLNGLLEDVLNRFDYMMKPRLHKDFDIGHFLEDKLAKAAKTIYKLKSHKTTLDQMKTLGVAVSMFDEAL